MLINHFNIRLIIRAKIGFRYALVLAGILNLNGMVFGQEGNLTFRGEIGAAIAGGRMMPFHLLSNQYGLLTPDKFNSWIKAGAEGKLWDKKFTGFTYGIDIVNRYSSKNLLYLHQSYGKLRLGFMTLQGGLIEERFGNHDSTLSSGGLLWSGNARPMPKVTLLVPKYTAVPFTKGYLEFMGGISHGWFGKNQFVNGAYLHHKYFYVQAGGKLPIHIHYGLHHFAQWGGVSKDSRFGALPSGWENYKRIFVADQGDENAPSMESHNRLGNHLGTRNFGMDIRLKSALIKFYWQNIFEDGSGLAYRNIKDGLWGMSMKLEHSKILQHFLFEYLHTTDQSGLVDYTQINGIQYILGGNDNYFNHTIYYEGWSYKGMTIGTPLITSPLIHQGVKKDYLRDNLVKALHTACGGYYHKAEFLINYTYSLHSGTNNFPFQKTRIQHSIVAEIVFFDCIFKHTDLFFSLTFDYGEMYGNNVGGLMKLRWELGKDSNKNYYNQKY